MQLFGRVCLRREAWSRPCHTRTPTSSPLPTLPCRRQVFPFNIR